MAKKKEETAVADPTQPTAKEMALSIASKEVIAQCRLAVIDTDEALEKAADLGKFAKMQLTNLDEERKLIVNPLNNVVKHVNARFKTISEPLSEAMDELRAKVNRFLKLKADAAEEDRRKAAEKARKEAEELAAIGDTATAQEIVAKAEETRLPAPTPARGSYGSVSTAKRLEISVEDESKIPRAYMMPDMTKIKEAVKDGVVIPGVKAEYVEAARFR